MSYEIWEESRKLFVQKTCPLCHSAMMMKFNMYGDNVTRCFSGCYYLVECSNGNWTEEFEMQQYQDGYHYIIHNHSVLTKGIHRNTKRNDYCIITVNRLPLFVLMGHIPVGSNVEQVQTFINQQGLQT